jgi:hypothetical protein
MTFTLPVGPTLAAKAVPVSGRRGDSTESHDALASRFRKSADLDIDLRRIRNREDTGKPLNPGVVPASKFAPMAISAKRRLRNRDARPPA